MVAIPIIDIGPLVNNTPDAGAVAATIGRACRETGFFYVVGHGIAPETVATVFAMAHAFFAQPLAEKQKAAFSGPSGNRGWIRLGSEILDPGKPHDLKEAFNIGLELPFDDPEVVAGRPFRGVNIWPDIPGFRTAALTYYDACWQLGRILHRAFAMDLGLAPDFFESVFTRPVATIRMLHYPPAPPELIGDCLMRWTNDTYVSTPHKVVSPPGRHRYSVAFFLDANPETIVECLPTCIAPERPAKYAPVSFAEFLHSRLAPTYEPAPREGAVPA